MEAADGYRGCIALPDNDIYEAVRRGDIKPLNTEVFCPEEAIVVLGDMRNNQMSSAPHVGAALAAHI